MFNFRTPRPVVVFLCVGLSEFGSIRFQGSVVRSTACSVGVLTNPSNQQFYWAFTGHAASRRLDDPPVMKHNHQPFVSLGCRLSIQGRLCGHRRGPGKPKNRSTLGVSASSRHTHMSVCVCVSSNEGPPWKKCTFTFHAMVFGSCDVSKIWVFAASRRMLWGDMRTPELLWACGFVREAF